MNNCNNCLKDCLKIKGLCEEAECANYYLSGFVPYITKKHFVDLATDGKSGKEFAEDLRCGAATEVLSDLQRINIRGVTISQAVKTQCYDCAFSSIYTAGGGMLIEPIISSELSLLSIPSLKIKSNNSGPEVLQVFNAVGELVYQTTVTLSPQVIQTIAIPGEFKTSSLYVKFENEQVLLSNIICKKSGCNCGSKKKNKFLNFYGYNGTTKTSNTYGFIPCVKLTCDKDDLICSVATTENNKQIIARLMAYKIGIKIFGTMLLSTNWRETQMNIDKDAVQANLDALEGKYHELMFGSKSAYGRGSTNGMAQILSQTAITMKDSCVVCNARSYKSTAVR